MKLKDGFVLEEVGGSYLAVAVGGGRESFSGLVRLNSTGAFLWNLMKDRDVSREELLEEVLKVYDVPSEVAYRDIVLFEQKLKDGGVLE